MGRSRSLYCQARKDFLDSSADEAGEAAVGYFKSTRSEPGNERWYYSIGVTWYACVATPIACSSISARHVETLGNGYSIESQRLLWKLQGGLAWWFCFLSLILCTVRV